MGVSVKIGFGSGAHRQPWQTSADPPRRSRPSDRGRRLFIVSTWTQFTSILTEFW